MTQTTPLTPDQKARFSALREREDHLTPNEAAELAALFKIIEDAEMVYLGPANEKLHQENEARRERIRRLQELAARKEAFLHHLETVLQDIQAERQAIDREYATLFDVGTNAISVAAAAKR